MSFTIIEKYLKKVGLLNDSNLSLLTQSANTDILPPILSILFRTNILTQNNFITVVQHKNKIDLLGLLRLIEKNNLLTQEVYNDVTRHQDLYKIKFLIDILQDSNLLNQDNFFIAVKQQSLTRFVEALYSLSRAMLLTQDNFNALINPEHALLITEEVNEIFWRTVGVAEELTQFYFNRLLIIAREQNPFENLMRLRNQILGLEDGLARGEVFNPRQSTHTTSVHRSVSESARKLMSIYCHNLNLEVNIAEIKAYVHGLDDLPIHAAAKRCIDRISKIDYLFTDSSGISTRQLLALSWRAMHDESKLEASLEDAKALFIEGLYEIQRGGNLNAENIDDMQADFPICFSGTFNKIVEKLNGIHKDVEVTFITHESAYLKFPKLANEQVLAYLRQFASPETVEEYHQVNQLLTEKDMEVLWEKIKLQVKSLLWEEFREAYGDNPEHRLFREMVDNGSYLECPDLTEIETQLRESKGYKDFMQQSQAQEALHRHGLWENRHQNAEAQHAFDIEYGLDLMPACKIM